MESNYNLVEPAEKLTLPAEYHTMDCQTWRVFDNPLMIPEQRKVVADLAITTATMMVSREMLIGYFGEIRKLLNSGNIITAFAWFEEIENRMQGIPPAEMLLDVACVYSVLPNEDPEHFREADQKKKREIWANDEDARGFFLLLAYKVITGLAEYSDPNFLTLIQTQQDRHQKVISHLRGNSKT